MTKYQEASARTRVRVSRTYQDDYVAVKPSEFLSKMDVNGLGLYANRTFQAGDVILEYKGKLISNQAANEKKKYKQYLFDVKQNGKVIHVLDGANNKYASAAKFANSTRTFQSRARNAEFVQRDLKIYLVASKRITPGREIIAYYGEHTLQIIDQK